MNKLKKGEKVKVIRRIAETTWGLDVGEIGKVYETPEKSKSEVYVRFGNSNGSVLWLFKRKYLRRIRK
jgi:hypothetical protein